MIHYPFRHSGTSAIRSGYLIAYLIRELPRLPQRQGDCLGYERAELLVKAIAMKTPIRQVQSSESYLSAVVLWHDMACWPLKKEPVSSKCRTDNRRASRPVRPRLELRKTQIKLRICGIAYAVYSGL